MSSNKSDRREKLMLLLASLDEKYHQLVELEKVADDIEALYAAPNVPTDEQIDNAHSEYLSQCDYDSDGYRTHVENDWPNGVKWAINFSHADLGKKGGG